MSAETYTPNADEQTANQTEQKPQEQGEASPCCGGCGGAGH
ncbi:Uncharacterised protein [Moraxella caviae]|uniref:CCGSCS motif protein n=1 Tax=Moraxella caviae TaxID=34060 RepID=A0A378R3N6_9GAMM|nr:hypothetical protein [Moraxella caviae]STZ09852.1 Uncharacterised protein [Moraxella caviae]VEW13072.1 Uncharacterised protein [Moraxella caviae]